MQITDTNKGLVIRTKGASITLTLAEETALRATLEQRASSRLGSIHAVAVQSVDDVDLSLAGGRVVLTFLKPEQSQTILSLPRAVALALAEHLPKWLARMGPDRSAN